MTTPLLEVDGLTKAYRTAAGEIQVLRGIHLEVQTGEMLAIVGASGVGKSTLLHVLGGLDSDRCRSIWHESARRGSIR